MILGGIYQLFPLLGIVTTQWSDLSPIFNPPPGLEPVIKAFRWPAAIFLGSVAITWLGNLISYALLINAWRKCHPQRTGGRFWTNVYAGVSLAVHFGGAVLLVSAGYLAAAVLLDRMDPYGLADQVQQFGIQMQQLREQWNELNPILVIQWFSIAACLSLYPFICIVVANLPIRGRQRDSAQISSHAQ